jgi:hypothetical protein
MDLTWGQSVDTLRMDESRSRPAQPRRLSHFLRPHHVTRPTLSTSELQQALAELLGMVHRINPPLNHYPHLFHEQKDAVARYIVDLQKRMGFRVTSPTSFSACQADAGADRVRVGGRSIPVERRSR